MLNQVLIVTQPDYVAFDDLSFISVSPVLQHFLLPLAYFRHVKPWELMWQSQVELVQRFCFLLNFLVYYGAKLLLDVLKQWAFVQEAHAHSWFQVNVIELNRRLQGVTSMSGRL